MSKFAIEVVVPATTLTACGQPAPRSDLAYLDRGTGTYVIDCSPCSGDCFDRYY